MNRKVIIDTGVLVAYLNKREKFHEWAKIELSKINPPLLTCEAVIVESYFLLKGTYGVLDLIFSGIAEIRYEILMVVKLIIRKKAVLTNS